MFGNQGSKVIVIYVYISSLSVYLGIRKYIIELFTEKYTQQLKPKVGRQKCNEEFKYSTSSTQLRDIDFMCG